MNIKWTSISKKLIFIAKSSFIANLHSNCYKIALFITYFLFILGNFEWIVIYVEFLFTHQSKESVARNRKSFVFEKSYAINLFKPGPNHQVQQILGFLPSKNADPRFSNSVLKTFRPTGASSNDDLSADDSRSWHKHWTGIYGPKFHSFALPRVAHRNFQRRWSRAFKCRTMLVQTTTSLQRQKKVKLIVSNKTRLAVLLQLRRLYMN